MRSFIKYWSYLVECEDKEKSFKSYLISEDKKTYIAKHSSEEDFDQEILDKFWNEIRNRIKGKPEADIDAFWMKKPFKELALFVKNFDSRNQSQKKEDSDKQEAIDNGAHYLGDMKNANGIEYEVWIPATHESAVILRNKYKGGNNIGTSWCISVAGNSRYWEDYVDKKGKNFIFLIKKNLTKSQFNYEINDKVAIELFINGNINIWDMDDNNYTLDVNDFMSIIKPIKEKAEQKKIFPNKHDNYITIGGKQIAVFRNSINCSECDLTSLKGSPSVVEQDFLCQDNNLTSLEGAPKKVCGNFRCNLNKLTSLEGGPQEVDGNFYCDQNQLTSLKRAPEKVSGSFYCYINKLTSLEGAPIEVGENFDCRYNQLTSLEGAPEKVGMNFDCYDNKLTSLKGAPQKINGTFDCRCNKLTSLEGGPQEVDGNFWCSNNELTSLKGSPQEVDGHFICEYNKLTSLEGAPQEVGRNFDCSRNKLTSLKGAPKEVDGDFDCADNKLTSLEGAPEKVGGRFYCSANKDLPEYKVDAYKAYLKLSDSEKVPLTKDNHYYPTEEWEYKFK